MADSKDKKNTAGKAKTTASKVKTTTAKKALATTSNTLTASTLPTADALKDRFKAGSIPLQSDFADLIDMANSGCRAAGQAAGQTGPGKGMRVSVTGQLEPDIGSYNFKNDVQGCSPVKVDTNTNQIVVDLHYGLKQNSSGLMAMAGAGIKVDADGIGIKSGVGIEVNDDGALQLKLNENYAGTDYAPVKMHDDILTIDLGSGLVNKDNGICVGAGNGIVVNANNISIDPNTVLPRGIITMFSGSKVPDGWYFCNGENGTPNLLDRFILGGYVEHVGEKNSATMSGGVSSKTFTVNTNAVTPNINVTVKGHALTVNEMPAHSHGVFGYQDGGGTQTAHNGHTGGPTSTYSTNTTGGGQVHTHDASATQASHDHQVEITVPYFILAFIMKS